MHTPEDSIEQVNLDYLLEQVKATTATAAHLADPIIATDTVYFPVILKSSLTLS